MQKDASHNVGHEGEVGIWPIFIHVRWIKSVLLELGCNNDSTVFWDGGSRPSRSDTLNSLVRNERRMCKDYMMRNVGAGSTSQLFDGALQIRFRTNCCEHGVNEVKEQSVDMKTAGSEPAVLDRMVSTFCSRKVRKSEAENVCLDSSPGIVETDRHSFFGLDELDLTILSQY